MSAPCTRCATLLEDGDLRCYVCALAIPALPSPVATERASILRCTQCAAAVAFDANKSAPACAFCGAVMAVEQPIDPIEVATRFGPFTVDREAARTALTTWLGSRGFFAPKALREKAIVESMQPLCWAAWAVDAQALVSWTADSNEGSRRSDWAPHAGQTTLAFDGITIPASRGLTPAECTRLVPHYDGSGFVTEAPPDAVVESFDAQRSAARQLVLRAIEDEARARVEREVPGRRVRKVHVSLMLERFVTHRVALPAWVATYRYRDSPYRVVVHGQDGTIVLGKSPVDVTKILAIISIVVAVAVVIALALLQ